MRNKLVYYIIICFLLILPEAKAQERSQTDSILNIISTASDTDRIQLFLLLSDQYISLNPDSSVLFSKKAYNSAKKTKDDKIIASCEFHLGKAYYYADSLEKSELFLLKAKAVIENEKDTGQLFNLYNYLTYVYFEMYKYDKALIYQNLSIEIETEIVDKEETAGRLNEFGMVYEYTGNTEKALIYYSQSLKLYRELADKEGIGDLLNNLGNVYHIMSNYQKALEYYLESLSLQNDIQNLIGIAIAKNNIGIVYHDWGQYEKALEYYQKALDTEKKLENENGISESLLNIAVVYHDMKDFDKALDYYKRSQEIAEKINNISILAIIYGNIADLHFLRNELTDALNSLEKSHALYESMGNEIGIGESYLMFGQIYFKNKQYQKALDYYKLSIAILKPRKIILSTADCYQGLADVYAALNKFDIAYEYYHRYHDIKDSVFSESMGKKINILEIENRENEIKLLNEAREREKVESDFINKQMKIQRVIGFVLIFAIIVIVALLIMLIIQLKIKRKNLSSLEKQHDEIVKNRFELLKAKEKAEESDRLKSVFLVNFTHEIRTPMNGIIGLSQLLKDKDISQEEMLDFAKQIHENSIELLNLLNNIIDISSIQTGQLKLKQDKILLPAFLHEIFTQYKSDPEFQVSDIEIVLNCKCENDTQIVADRERLFQVLEHLIDNAFKYTEKGKIEISCKIANNTSHISISDTGIGVPENKQSLIFEKFTQLDYSSTRKYKGAGIGLALSKALIELMNGTIKVKSKPEVGSTFIIIFPLNTSS